MAVKNNVQCQLKLMVEGDFELHFKFLESHDRRYSWSDKINFRCGHFKAKIL